MRVIDENTVTDAVLEQMSSTADPRLKEVMAALVRHLHGFAREVDLKPEEWLAAIAFLTAVGQKCTPHRQEFILLSDTLGLSTVVNALHDKRMAEAATKSSILGPYYRQNSPVFKLGDRSPSRRRGSPSPSMAASPTRPAKASPALRLKSGRPTRTATTTCKRPRPRRWICEALPRRFPGPLFPAQRAPARLSDSDGWAGRQTASRARAAWLPPAHIHFLVGAPGYREVVTAAYLASDAYLDSDTVFGVMPSLVTEPRAHDASSPFPDLPSLRFDFTLAAETKGAGSGRVGADASQIAV